MRKRTAYNSGYDLPAKKRLETRAGGSGLTVTDTTEHDGPSSKPSSCLGDVSENDDEGMESHPLPPPPLPSPTPMDPELRDLIQKYVRADYVVHCLELAGFDSPAVFACLTTEATIRQLEAFVGATCALMTVPKVRERFLGPLYANHPANFKLPAGVVCGLRLAVEELRKTRPFYFTSSSSAPATPHESFSDAGAQTELSFPAYAGRSASITSSSEGSPPDPAFAGAPEPSLPPPLAHIPTSEGLPFDGSALMDCKRLFDGLGHFPLPPPQSVSTAPTTPRASATPAETIDVERLIHHSSASACRLAARQFVNANLIRGQHFDMEMEVTGGEGGQKRVTGIFYCHLCREKRERTCAVRFSVARNRYPVMSNVLSHLKTHFQYQATIGIGGSGKKLSSASPPPPQALVGGGNSGNVATSNPPTAPPNPFLSPSSFCNLMSRVVQFAASANPNAAAAAAAAAAVSGAGGELNLPPLTPPAMLQPKLSPVN